MIEKAVTCPLCGGGLVQGTTTFTADFGAGVVVVRHVPADICDLCGEAWVGDAVAEKLEKLVNEAKTDSRQFEVVDMAA
jgi:YgiT-type zinc finger domain-containing protein